MRIFNVAVFDEVIAGTANAWYTPATDNDLFGTADGLFLQATTSNASGVLPSLTCQFEHSGDGMNWVPVGSADIISASIPLESEASFAGSAGMFTPTLLRFVRIKISLGGTLPRCRLKLSVTGRVFRFLRKPA